MLIDAGGSTVPVSLGNSIPDSDGTFVVALADFGPNTESGEGVLSRITLKGENPGTSALTLADVLINDRNYDVTGDGERFLVTTPLGTSVPMTVVVNWPGRRR